MYKNIQKNPNLNYTIETIKIEADCLSFSLLFSKAAIDYWNSLHTRLHLIQNIYIYIYIFFFFDMLKSASEVSDYCLYLV